MNLLKLFNDDDAVSPVIGVILMVAITVILAAVIGAFVLGLGDSISTTAPQASFGFSYTDSTADSLTVTHEGGDPIPASELNASVSGAENDSVSASYSGNLFDSTGDVTAGQTGNLNSSTFDDGDASMLDLSQANVRVIWESANGESSATLGKWSGPDA